MDVIAFTPSNTTLGALGKGSGGDPPRGSYHSKGGDTEAALWLYDIKAAKAYILEWRSCFPL